MKLGLVAVGSLIVAKYAEPIVDTPEIKKWIEDRGDFVIVRIPDFKTFANEVINKPAIFIMGQQAALRGVDVGGYVNVYAPDGGLVEGCRFDASQALAEHDRPVMKLQAANLKISDCHFFGTGQTPAFGFTGYSGPTKTIQLADIRGDIKEKMVLGISGLKPYNNAASSDAVGLK